VIVRLSGDGDRLRVHRIVNDPFELATVMAECGDAPEVVIEATYGWYWAVDVLQGLGATVHPADQRALNWADRRVKNDVIDADRPARARCAAAVVVGICRWHSSQRFAPWSRPSIDVPQSEHRRPPELGSSPFVAGASSPRNL
jgi:hypothetical protein